MHWLAGCLFALGIPLAHAQSTDIAVTKSDGTSTYTPGTSTTYTITVTNNGPNATTRVDILDLEPPGTTFAWTCTAGGGAICPAGAGSGDIDSFTGAFPVGGLLTYTVIATTTAGRTGSLTNEVSADPATADPVSGNNVAEDVNTAAPSADIAVTKDNGSTTYLPGDTTVYTVVVTNDGPSDATNVVIEDNEPDSPAIAVFTAWSCVASGTAGTACPNGSGSGPISETVPILPAGGILTYTVTAEVAKV